MSELEREQQKALVSQRTAFIISLVFGLATVTALGLAIYSIVRNEQLAQRNRELQQRLDEQLNEYDKIIKAADETIARLEKLRQSRRDVNAALIDGIATLQRNAELARQQRAQILRTRAPQL